MQDIVEACSCQNNNKSLRSRSKSQQQPGQYLCVDTRKKLDRQTIKSSNQQIHLHDNKGFRNHSTKEKVIHTAPAVQPDNLCKLKTILAVDYVQDFLETNRVPVSDHKFSPLKISKRGQLKPLLFVKQLDKPQITKCLGIQNDRRRIKPVLLDNESQSPIEAATTMSTRFSSANKMLSKKDIDVDLRKLSLVNQNSIEMDAKPFSELGTEEESICCKQVQDNSIGFDDFVNDQQFTHNNDDDCNFFGDDIDDGNSCSDNALIDQKINSKHENHSNVQQEFNYQYSNHESTLHDNNLSENNEGICQDFKLRNPDMCTNENKKTTPMKNSFKPSNDLDNIQVKDIWKALHDGGYDISRKEVSKYKVNTTKSPTRIKSAPTRWRNSQTNRFYNDIPRSRSAYGGKGSQNLRSSLEDVSVSGKSDNLSEEENLREKGGKDLSCRENIEVVAQKKSFSKLPRAKNLRPLVAALNFKINTRPKHGHFFYFAYGLNMNSKRLEIQLRRKIGERYWGLLFGFKLIFNKKGSLEGGVGFPNIVAEPGFSVEGCVYELPQDCLPLLDTSVGFPKHYARLVLQVWLCNSLIPDDHGVAQHCVPAVVYVAQNDWVVSNPMTLDNSFTLKQCLLGIDLLTPNYQEFLSSLTKQL